VQHTRGMTLAGPHVSPSWHLRSAKAPRESLRLRQQSLNEVSILCEVSRRLSLTRDVADVLLPMIRSNPESLVPQT
jgi:hypothetical protein